MWRRSRRLVGCDEQYHIKYNIYYYNTQVVWYLSKFISRDAVYCITDGSYHLSLIEVIGSSWWPLSHRSRRVEYTVVGSNMHHFGLQCFFSVSSFSEQYRTALQFSFCEYRTFHYFEQYFFYKSLYFLNGIFSETIP